MKKLKEEHHNVYRFQSEKGCIHTVVFINNKFSECNVTGMNTKWSYEDWKDLGFLSGFIQQKQESILNQSPTKSSEAGDE